MRRVHLAWTRYKPHHARIEFVDEGRHEVDRDQLELEFRNLIDAVLERLHGDPELSAAADNLALAWRAINDLNEDELALSRAAALLESTPSTYPIMSPMPSSRSGSTPTRRFERTHWRSRAAACWRPSTTG